MTMQQPQTETIEHPHFSRFMDWLACKGDQGKEGKYRDEMLAGLTGRVLEVGAGNGINFHHYPASVSEVVAVEPERHSRARAAVAAQQAPVTIIVEDAVAGSLPYADATYDAGIASLVLCSVSDQDKALAELFRVIRPGGELRFYEHVVAERRPFPALMRAADATFWPRLLGGCHTARDTRAAIERAGFVIETDRRLFLGLPHIVGRARRP